MGTVRAGGPSSGPKGAVISLMGGFRMLEVEVEVVKVEVEPKEQGETSADAAQN